MTKVSRGLETILSEADKAKAIKEIIGFFQSERGEEIGLIAAEEVLAMFMQRIAPAVYNAGIHAAKERIGGLLESADVELEALKQ
ncbi:MAG: DUF2164 family protein [Candidatus Doudnabacteria bacterium]|nr:DUF2164 family protein [Candidatus Doudnabacteria bacterium]